MKVSDFKKCFSKDVLPLVEKVLSERKQNAIQVQSITYTKETVHIHLRFYKSVISCKLRNMYIVTLNSLIIKDISR